jgi:hypothetical protein
MGASSTSAKKGQPSKNPGGRPKGSLNKVTTDMRAAIREAFELEGGVKYLRKLAKEDPKTFTMLLSKIVPRELEVESKGKGWEQILNETLERARATPRPSKDKPGAPAEHPQQRTPRDAGAPGDQ